MAHWLQFSLKIGFIPSALIYLIKVLTIQKSKESIFEFQFERKKKSSICSIFAFEKPLPIPYEKIHCTWWKDQVCHEMWRSKWTGFVSAYKWQFRKSKFWGVFKLIFGGLTVVKKLWENSCGIRSLSSFD